MADILIIDDQDRYTALCRRAIPQHRYRGPARSWREASDVLSRARGRVELVLLDVHFDIDPEELIGYEADLSKNAIEALKRRQGLEILRVLRQRYPDLPVVLMTSLDELPTGDGSSLDVEEYTYFLDDDYVDARALDAQIASIVAARRGEESDGPVFWGHALPMRRIRQRLGILARGRLPVVLLGPTGTGKSLLARHIVHARSGRPGRFVQVDLSTVPRELMAAHLFGALKGAYTGSVSDRPGAFEAADRGTLFLDEVGNLSDDAQKMLLTVLQEGTVMRLGALKATSVDVKLVVATNEDLAARVREGTFRADLYMRLNPSTAVTLPALSERAIDLDKLLSFTLDQALERPYLADMVRDYRETHGLGRGPVAVRVGAIPERRPATLVFLFPERTVRLLRRHSWPGNLREFAMVVENAVLFALAELVGVPGGDRVDVLQVRPKLIRDLLTHTASPTAVATSADGEGVSMPLLIRPQDSLNKVAQECERQYFRRLYLQEKGDFGSMAGILLGDVEHARKVQLRFNQLGLKVRELKALLQS